MQVLIYGFQRSGTTLLRRLVQLHPDVKKVFHEQGLLQKQRSNMRLLKTYLQNFNINIKNDNWGEKVPYYSKAKGMSVTAYCETWLRAFPRQGKIIHIIRHPYDVSLSVVKKYKHETSIKRPLNLYKRMVPKVLNVLDNNDCVLNIKYEDLLIKPDETMYDIYNFCDLTPDIDYKEIMKKNINERYRAINPKRAFAYKKKKIVSDIDMTDTIEILNNLEGVKYEI